MRSVLEAMTVETVFAAANSLASLLAAVNPSFYLTPAIGSIFFTDSTRFTPSSYLLKLKFPSCVIFLFFFGGVCCSESFSFLVYFPGHYSLFGPTFEKF